LFAVTLFVSAFILFLVQPIIGRLILPKLGGAPQVWNTCMVFFQSVLLAGYAYSHYVTTRLPFKRQLVVHALVILLPFLVLLPFGGPFNVTSWVPPAGANPIFSTLALLAFVVGLPFFAVSTSAPLLQKWFTRTDHPSAHDPYFLYSASNVGSLLALVAYPFLIEPLIGLSAQTWTWTWFYVIFVGAVFVCVAMLYQLPDTLLKPVLAGPELTTADGHVPAPDSASPQTAIKIGTPQTPASTGFTKKKPFKPGQKPAPVSAPAFDYSQPRSDHVTGWRRLRWILLAAIPTSLMLGVTTYISVDLSPFPLVWTIPLALYLLSFILVYSKWPTTWLGAPHQVVLFIQPLALLALAMLVMNPTIALLLPMLTCFVAFFLTALMCHGELAVDRPTPEHLTEYFLLMSLGGMLGGVLNGIIAPILFVGVLEFPLAIIIAGFLRPKQRELGWTDEFVLKSSPNLEQWAIQKSNEYSEKHGQPRTGRPFVFGYVMDVVLGLFVMGGLFIVLHYFFDTGRILFNILRIVGFEEDGAQKNISTAHRFFVFVVPMIVLFFFAARPYRFGLGLLALLGIHFLMYDTDRRELVPGGAKRTYFGVLRVYVKNDPLNKETINEKTGRASYLLNVTDPDLQIALPREILQKIRENGSKDELTYGVTTGLLHGTTQHGQNFHWPPQLRRLATTYYHRLGPIGAVMERYNWFEKYKSDNWDPKKFNARTDTTGQLVWTGDARLPAAMVGLGAADLFGVLPGATLANSWSEPPIATIGLGTGTMSSYGRPYQHMVFYEIDDQIRNFSEPFQVEDTINKADTDMTASDEKLRKPWFTYLRDSRLRGAQTEVIMGDARLSLEREKERADLTVRYPLRENYYKVMVIDAFSSDAIPVHLITKEGIKTYLEHLTDDGVICVHTSNRHVNLIKPVVDIANELGLDYLVGKDFNANYIGHTSSEYVMLARKSVKRMEVDDKGQEKEVTYSVLGDLYKIPGESARTTRSGKVNGPIRGSMVRWYHPAGYGMRVWTDDYTNMVSIIRWPWDHGSED